ncbi:hypothetical protein HPB50_000158 [Hyalomma asiaticum]|uniref:Uncharacterized protein n=1 Tax=Hyalomma asiaticum TaxID=266040 RepID=A0ACB7TC65_HYAAI|nr:hypothetical protein HPB50_000158 [Hyalomma asiaticum]
MEANIKSCWMSHFNVNGVPEWQVCAAFTICLLLLLLLQELTRQRRRQLEAAARVTTTWHVYYIGNFTGSLKVFQVIAAIPSIVLLTVGHYVLNLNHPTMQPHAFTNMLCSTFFLSSLVNFMLFVMDSTDVPCSIFYWVHCLLATVGFIVSGQHVHQPGEPTGSRQDRLVQPALCVSNSLTSFADTLIAYEPTIDCPLGVESK